LVRRHREGLRALALTLAVAACSEGSPSPQARPTVSTSPPEDDVAPGLRGGPSAPKSSTASAPNAAPSPLATLHGDLEALRGGTRREHVRILVLGDSHTAADLWTGEMRRALQASFGDGGPGFVHLGVPGARHDQLTISQDGHTATEPKVASTVEPTGDGVLGLGGVLARPKKGKTTLLVKPRAPFAPDLRWEVCVRPGRTPSRVVVTPRGGAVVVRELAPTQGPQGLDRLTTVTKSPHELEIRIEGDAATCGAIAETDAAKQPGVVLDALGINGARLATLLARDAAAFQADVKRRAPSLVVIEYGGNEAADEGTDPSVFADELGRVVERVRVGAPRASCLVVGPTEQVARPARTAAVARALGDRAEALGCGFWDAQARLGGAGAMQRMMEERPPRAHVDGIHLLDRGYRDLAKLTLEDLLRGVTP
jgi:lysophospholipase L1-like esterase